MNFLISSTKTIIYLKICFFLFCDVFLGIDIQDDDQGRMVMVVVVGGGHGMFMFIFLVQSGKIILCH